LRGSIAIPIDERIQGANRVSDVVFRGVSAVRPRDLEILIPAYNEERRLADTLAALAGHLRRRGIDGSLRVIDNGSSDRTTEVVDRATAAGIAVTVTGCSRRGKGAAVARGMLTRCVEVRRSTLPMIPGRRSVRSC